MNLTFDAMTGNSASDMLIIDLSGAPNIASQFNKRVGWDKGDPTGKVLTYTYEKVNVSTLTVEYCKYAFINNVWTELSQSLSSQVEANRVAIANIKDGTSIDSFSDVETAIAGITPAHLYCVHLKLGTDYAIIGITPTIDAFETGQSYVVYDGTYRLTAGQRTAMKKVLSGISGNETEIPFQLYGALVNKTTRTCIELTDFTGVTQAKIDFNNTNNNVYTIGGTWVLTFTQLI